MDIKDLGDLFSTACVQQLGLPARLVTWATGEKLVPVTDQGSLRIYAGLDGKAWQISTPGNLYIVADRSERGCAVFAEHADPKNTTQEFEDIVRALPSQLGTPKPLPDRTGSSPYGLRTMKVLIGFDDRSKQIKSTMMLLTQEQSGGAYQATMQLSGMNQ